jgi:hypothetical protein
MEHLRTVGCGLVPPRGSLTTLLSLPQCLAAFGTILSTLAWLDQSPVSQHVSSTSHQVITSTIVTTSTMTQGGTEYKSTITPRYGRGVGFMEVWGAYCILLWSSPRCQQFAAPKHRYLYANTRHHTSEAQNVSILWLWAHQGSPPVQIALPSMLHCHSTKFKPSVYSSWGNFALHFATAKGVVHCVLLLVLGDRCGSDSVHFYFMLIYIVTAADFYM